MTRLVIVPARGGSKRLPDKNCRVILGKPLINYTVEVVRDCFDLVVVTSDSEAILQVVEPCRNVLTLLRPPDLATDTSKVIDTVLYYYQSYDQASFDQLWLCLPTCPLRTREDLRLGQAKLSESVDGVVSITDYEFPPALGLIQRDGLLLGAEPSHPLAAGNSRSQDHGGVYRPNGAFYGMWWEAFRVHRNFYRGRIKGCHMPRERSVDIDTELDLAIAEALLKTAKVGPTATAVSPTSKASRQEFQVLVG